jgi:hypothetical protein
MCNVCSQYSVCECISGIREWLDHACGPTARGTCRGLVPPQARYVNVFIESPLGGGITAAFLWTIAKGLLVLGVLGALGVLGVRGVPGSLLGKYI